MAAENAQAIVIRTVPFGETSSVVTLFTREFGKLRALAKGAWRPKSGFDAALDLLSICQVLVLRKSSGGLDLLTEARLDYRFRVGRSMAAFHGGMEVAELLDALTADADPQPELFDVVEHTLLALSGYEGPDRAVRALLVHAQLDMLRLVGHAPALLACAECRTRLEPQGRFAFGMLDGGGLCPRCRQGKRSVVSISADAMAALRLLAGSADAWRTIDLPDRVAGELRAIMNTYFANLLGRRLRCATPAARDASGGIGLPDEHVARPPHGLQFKPHPTAETIARKTLGREAKVQDRRVLALGKHPQRGSLGTEGFEARRDDELGGLDHFEHDVGGRKVHPAITVPDPDGHWEFRVGLEDGTDVDMLPCERDPVGDG